MQWENFTAGRIAAFKCAPDKKQSIFWDGKTPSLGLRVTAAGVKSYIFETSLNGKTLRITIGSEKTWTISDAQAAATAFKSQTDRGIDPRQVRADGLAAQQAKLAAKAAEALAQQIKEKHETLTLGMVWPLYIEARRKRWSDWHIRDHENMVRLGGLKKLRGKGLTEAGPLAALLDVRLAELSGKCIAAWLAKEAETRPTQAALSFRLLSVFANWCDSQDEYAGLIPAGACKAKQVKDELPKGKSKEGDCLQKEQLPRWFAAVRGLNNPSASAYLQGLLLTGARRRELAELRWEDVNFEWNSLTIRDKVEGERTIPLTPYFKSLLLGLIRRNEWVFSSPASVSGKLVEPTAPHHRALLAADLPHLTLHGLRRSFNTLSEWVEAPTGVVAQIMGHKPSAISERHYKRRPLDLLRVWHTKIEAWFLEQAEVDFQEAEQPVNLQLVARG